jgi:protein-disulfide isomerase
LSAVVTLAALFGVFIRAESPLGQGIRDNLHGLAVQQDESSPADHNPAADLKLIVFTDYRCAACRSAYPAMKRAVKADRKVRIIYKDWPIFGDASERAAQIAIASDFQNIYPLVHDRLMTGVLDNEDDLRSAVQLSGGDWRRLQNDLVKNRTDILAQINRNRSQAFGLGLRGTPGYLIGHILVRGAMDEAEFTRVFRQARRED